MKLGIEGNYRPHHYHFAHRLIPGLFYHQPIKFLGVLNFEGQDFLETLWATAAEEQNLSRQEILASHGLKSVELHDYDENCLANIITMPRAQFEAEAIMICMLARVSANSQSKLKAEAQTMFTLEHDGSRGDVEAPYLCQWTEDGTHITMGRKYIETAEEFFKVCKFNFRPTPKRFLQKLFSL